MIDPSILMRPLVRERQGLLDLIARLKSNLVGIEIGSYLGESAELFVQSGKFSAFYCVDPWINGYDAADAGSSRCDMKTVEALFDVRMQKHPTVTKIKKQSSEAAIGLPDQFFDFLYVDGMHTYEAVKSDLLSFLPKMKKDGVVAGHDWGWKGLTEAIREVVGEPSETFVDGSWIKYLPLNSSFCLLA